jgi:hypothetical protein
MAAALPPSAVILPISPGETEDQTATVDGAHHIRVKIQSIAAFLEASMMSRPNIDMVASKHKHFLRVIMQGILEPATRAMDLSSGRQGLLLSLRKSIP